MLCAARHGVAIYELKPVGGGDPLFEFFVPAVQPGAKLHVGVGSVLFDAGFIDNSLNVL
jgi:hypothetical protein